MINEQLWESLTQDIPEGSKAVGLRVGQPCTVTLFLDEKLDSSVTVTAQPDDGDMPDSGFTLMSGINGQKSLRVEVSEPCNVWGLIE